MAVFLVLATFKDKYASQKEGEGQGTPEIKHHTFQEIPHIPYSLERNSLMMMMMMMMKIFRMWSLAIHRETEKTAGIAVFRLILCPIEENLQNWRPNSSPIFIDAVKYVEVST